MKRIYLDHAAATPVDKEVFLAMQPFFFEQSANPSAIHREGVEARRAVEHARANIAESLRAHPDEIVFTAGATESANLALIGAVNGWRVLHPGRPPHLIISAIEHDAVFAPVRILEKEGVRVSVLPVDEEGIAKVDALSDMIEEDTVLVGLMYANNEIGTVQPVAEAAKKIRKWKKEFRGVIRSERIRGDARYPLLYSDASQAPNYLECHVPTLGVDMMTLSAGKIYGGKGVGLLYTQRGALLAPLLHGGGQEGGRRAGTENIPAIVGFSRALQIAGHMREGESARLSGIRDETIVLLVETFPDIVINGSTTYRLPNNINFSLPGVDHEYLTIALDARGFAVATKSACSETEAEVSHVLVALGGEKDNGRPTSGIRVSMGRETTAEEMNEFVATLSAIKDTMMGTL